MSGAVAIKLKINCYQAHIKRPALDDFIAHNMGKYATGSADTEDYITDIVCSYQFPLHCRVNGWVGKRGHRQTFTDQ